MSRAEERARQAFPGHPFIHDRCVFKFGYEQAEKDIKDALLEWLDGKLTIEGAAEGFVGGYDSALKEVIDKINEL